MKDVCGIYSLVNLVTGGRYIGSSIHIMKRCKEHFYALASQRHDNRKLQAAYDEYGRNAFAYEILKEVKELELAKWEQYYIDRLKPTYNQTDIVERYTDVIARATQWLREQLADGEPHNANDVLLRARQRGMSKRTIQYISKQLQTAGEITVRRCYIKGRSGVQAWLWQKTVA